MGKIVRNNETQNPNKKRVSEWRASTRFLGLKAKTFFRASWEKLWNLYKK